MDALPFIAIGAGGYLLLTRDMQPEIERTAAPRRPPFATTLIGNRIAVTATATGNKLTADATSPKISIFGSSYSGTSSTASKDQVAAVLARAQKEYDKLGEEAKVKAAKVLSDKLGLKPPLTGKESWKQLISATSSAGAMAACGVLPGGQIAVPLCGIIGAYFGGKLADWLSDAQKAVTSALKDGARTVADAASDAAGASWDEVKSWF